jgi:hypothetical protein
VHTACEAVIPICNERATVCGVDGKMHSLCLHSLTWPQRSLGQTDSCIVEEIVKQLCTRTVLDAALQFSRMHVLLG